MKEKFIKIFNFFDDDTPYYAASLSFFTIFSILPLIALLIAIVSKVPAISEHMELMTSYIFDFINPTHSQSMINTLTRFLENTDKLGNIGIFYLLFVFTMFFKDYEHIVNKIYGTPTRAVYKLFFMYLGFMILIPVLFILFIFVSTLPYLQVTFVTQVITFIFIWNIFIMLFILSANTKVTFKSAAAASLITLATLSITKKLFAFYVESNSTYATIYGSFSVALIFFLWIYVSWNIYLYGTKLCSILNKYELDNIKKRKILKIFKYIFVFFIISSITVFAEDAPPMVNLSIASVDQPAQFVRTINIAIILALFVLAPTLILMVTSFTRLIIVFGLLRQALGLQQSPPNQIIISLSLILTFFIMEPYAKQAWEKGINPYMNETIGYEVAFTESVGPFKEFMIKNTREKDLALMYRIKKQENPANIEDVSLTILMPAFIISELRTAFEIGFLIFLPFLVIDIIVASILMSLGMMMLPPVMISLPIKLIFFIIIDGWHLIIGNLAQSFK